jgi:archaellum component FlaC
MLEIQMQLKDKEILNLTEKIDRLERSREQTIKEKELLSKEISILQDLCSKEEVFFLGAREKYP